MRLRFQGITLACALLLASALTARAAEIVLDDVRLPSDVQVSSSLGSTEATAFLGAWAGSWGGSLHHVLVVESVDASGLATLVYATGRERELGLRPVTRRRTGTIRDGVLTIAGRADVTYRPAPDGTLEALYVHDAVRAHARMRRVSLDTLRSGVVPAWDEPERIVLPGPPEDGAPSRLVTLLFRPDGPGPFPLLVVHHGSTGFGTDPAQFGRAWWHFGLADFLRRRGYLVAFPQRRGRGGSSGLYDEGFSPDRSQGYACEADLALAGAERSLADAEAATLALRRRPDVAPGRVLVAGQSRGGILAIAYAGRHPDAVAGVLNFAGGWLGAGCDTAEAVTGRLAREGGAFPRPTLWLYGEGDAFYPFRHSLANFEAFRSAGGRGTIEELPVPGEQRGHGVLDHRDLWRAPVEAYLDALGAPPGPDGR